MKKIFIILILSLFIVSMASFALAQNGSGNETMDDESECTVDADCEENEVCDNGECEDIEDEMDDDSDEAECTTDADCEEGKVCDNNYECEDLEDEMDDDSDDEKTEEEIEEETVDEATDARTMLGAEIRVLQLKRSVVKAVIREEIVVDYLSDKEEDVNELEILVEELASISLEIDAMLEAKDLSPEEFVELKKASRESVQNFRKMANELLTSDDKEELRMLFADANYSELELINERIRTRTREHNRNQAEIALKRIGAENAEIARKLGSGEITPEQAKEMMQNEYKGLSEQAKEVAKMKIEEAKQIREEARERAANRYEEQKEALEQMRERLDERKEQAIELRDKLREIRDGEDMPGERR